MDNASVHKGGRIDEIVQKADCSILYLPTYSPDLNPIEHHWVGIKNTVRSFLPSVNYDLLGAFEKAFEPLSI